MLHPVNNKNFVNNFAARIVLPLPDARNEQIKPVLLESLSKDSFKKNTNSKDKKNNKLIAAILTGTLAAGALVLILKNRMAKNLEFADLKKIFQEKIKAFPDDKPYLYELAKAIGLKNGEEFRLASVMGQNELKSVLKNACYKDFSVGENFEGIRNFTYKINLHNHTSASDGMMKAEELLSQAARWADEISAHNKSPYGFIVSISDHDITDSAQEAIKLIALNPQKYKNLRFVPGVEASMSFVRKKDVAKPIHLELVGYSINPFDKTLNEFLEKLRTSRINASKNVLEEYNAAVSNLNLNWEEAKNFHPNLGLGTSNGNLWILRQYAAFRLAAVEYAKRQNNKISPDEIVKKCAKEYMQLVSEHKIAEGDAVSYFKQLKLDGLSRIDNFTVDAATNNLITKIRDKYVFNTEYLLDSQIITTPEKFFETTKKSPYGFYGTAHPGFLNTGGEFSADVDNFIKNNPWCNKAQHVIWRLFKHLKETGANLFDAYEANYQSYDNAPGRAQWVKMVNDVAESFKLTKTGGIDCHKNSILTKHSFLTKEQIAEYNLGKITGDLYDSVQ